MRLVITLIATGRNRALPGCAAALRKALQIAAEPVWLAAKEACDLLLDAPDPRAVAATARALAAGAPFDVLVQPVAARRKRLLVSDLEATIIGNEMLDELGDILGIGPRIEAITRRAMNGEMDFEQALTARVAMLAGAETSILAEAKARIRITPGARTLIATMCRSGAVTALVTGGFTVFAEPVAAELGVDRVVANRLEIIGGRLTGRVLPPIVGGDTKRQVLLNLAAEIGIASDQVLAVGDGANDVPMLEAAGFGVAFHAKASVAATAPARLDHANLTGLLYAQGYSKADFVRRPAAHP